MYILELSSWLDDVGPSSYRSKIKREQLEGESSSCHLVDDKAFVHNLHLWFSSTWENSPRCLGYFSFLWIKTVNGQRCRWPVAVRSTTTDHDDDDDRIKREKKVDLLLLFAFLPSPRNSHERTSDTTQSKTKSNYTVSWTLPGHLSSFFRLLMLLLPSQSLRIALRQSRRE